MVDTQPDDMVLELKMVVKFYLLVLTLEKCTVRRFEAHVRHFCMDRSVCFCVHHLLLWDLNSSRFHTTLCLNVEWAKDATCSSM